MRIVSSLCHTFFAALWTLKFQNGYQYFGHVSLPAEDYSKRHGLGRMEYPGRFSGDRSEGYWKHGVRQGLGWYQFEEGEFYQGMYVEGRRCGFGVFRLTDGEEYTGYFKNSEFEGPGTLRKGNEDVWEGDWKGGVFHGKNLRCTAANGEVHVANWDRGVRDSKGTLGYPDGSVYVGEWDSEGRPHGLGTMKYVSGRVFDGEWKAGREFAQNKGEKATT